MVNQFHTYLFVSGCLKASHTRVGTSVDMTVIKQN